MIYIALFNLLAVLIEAWRIKRVKGKVANINKKVTRGIAFFGGLFSLILHYAPDYYYTPNPFEVLFFSGIYVGTRGVFYDPVLNLLRGLKIGYTSEKTNSKVDRVEEHKWKLSFWQQRLLYFILLTGSLLLWLWIK